MAANPLNFSRLSRMARPREFGPDTPVADLRTYYNDLTQRYGAMPEDCVAERGRLGSVKGEWLRAPESDSNRLILYFHGGGYVGGTAEAHRPLIARLCKAAGAAALSLDYRLGPEFPFPAGLRDGVDAYRLLIAEGIASSSVVLAGDGAGGGLAFATMLAIRNAHLPMPAACVAMSPWADLTLSGWSLMQNAKSDPYFSWDLLFVSARHYLRGHNPADPYASPIFGSFRDCPPIMVHAGSQEILRDDASRLGEAAAAAQVPVSVEIYDGMGHLFQVDASSAEAKVSLMRLGQFIRSKTQSAGAAPPAAAANG